MSNRKLCIKCRKNYVKKGDNGILCFYCKLKKGEK